MKIVYRLIIYSGIAAALCLVVTFVLGITKSDIEMHEAFGIATLALGITHAGLVVYKNLRIKASQKLFK
ncbi:MAG: hypothetical protein JW919_02615 [Candidatus Omnitrophica bacterium]|nr:hypothetical protein [Candidatus Omnitrophota bacterium]